MTPDRSPGQARVVLGVGRCSCSVVKPAWNGGVSVGLARRCAPGNDRVGSGVWSPCERGCPRKGCLGMGPKLWFRISVA